MKVYKFGGASIKDAEGFKNVCNILQAEKDTNIVVVISALGKTTNALEKVVEAYYHKTGAAQELFNEVVQSHLSLLNELIPDKHHTIYKDLNNCFVEVEWVLEDEPQESYDYLYDQIVSVGEMASTKIAAAYFQSCGINIKWHDAREWIKTDNSYREAKVNWNETEMHIQRSFPSDAMLLTQGFIGCTSENFTTTLGREGSDYTAAIIAYCLNADSVTIWKDVPGVLNADPRYFPDARLIPELSYYEAIEMTYYGASVIHPKTIKPLQNKNIPLHVRSFINPKNEGTLIKESTQNEKLPPIWVKKIKQTLISISAKDFSFITEDNISSLFRLLFECGLKVNLMQNSALSFSVCVDGDEQKIKRVLEVLRHNYKVLISDQLELVTVRHYQTESLDSFLKDKKIYLEQRSRSTAQVVYA